MTDPRVLSIISVVFALLSTYNLYTGSRRMRDARRAGKPIRWYKQTSLLTGIEYSLLTFVFLLSTASQQGNIAPNIRGLVGLLYFLLLIPAAIIAGLVIRQGILTAREARAGGGRSAVSTASTVQTLSASKSSEQALSKHEQEVQAQHQRERRKKAAAARRRRAGKA